MSSNPTPGDKHRKDSADAPQPTAKDHDALDPQLLEQVLSETVLNAPGTGDPMAPEEMEALYEVARRHPGKPLTLQPVAVELVEALLMRRFPDQADREFWKHLANRIATTLMDDPPTQERLAVFWASLRDTVK